MSSMARKNTRATLEDASVGLRIRERRIDLGLTQQQLADLIGVTYQQAHKYEKGINRITAARLHRVSQALSVDVNYFYEGINSNTKTTILAPEQRMLEFSRNIKKITNPVHLKAVYDLVRALANSSENTE